MFYLTVSASFFINSFLHGSQKENLKMIRREMREGGASYMPHK